LFISSQLTTKISLLQKWHVMPTHFITCTFVGISFVAALVTFRVFGGLAFASYAHTIDAPI
jgi:hypothetical protein